MPEKTSPFASSAKFEGELSRKIKTSIKRIQEHEPAEGYHLAFSGGKDSIVIHSLAEKSGVKFDAHFNVTTVDPPEVLQFIKINYPQVIWDRPKRSMFQLILHNSLLPTRTHRFCCRSLKETSGNGRTIITGIRWEESVKRAGRPIFHASNKRKNTYFLNPIADWTYDDVWDYIAINRIPFCSLYLEGKHRIGCILCPFQSPQDKEYDINRYPKFVNAYKGTIRRLFAILQEQDRLPKEWKSPEQAWEWWIYGHILDHSTVQTIIPGVS